MEILFIFLANCFNVIMIIFKNPRTIEDVNSLRYFLHNFNTLILKMMVVLWIPNSLTSLGNFYFSLNLLKTCPWWYATSTIPLFFILIISSYRLIISAAFSGSCVSSASLFKFSNSTTSSVVLESNNCFLSLLLTDVSPFYYLPRLSTSINKKIITLVPNLKQKYLPKLNFFARL